MGRVVKIRSGNIKMLAQLNDTKIASLIWDTLPICASASKWGDEIYFSIPVAAKLSKPQGVVEKGDLGYWEEGQCFCIFFGPTPISSKGEIKPANPVEVIGKVCDTPEELKKINPGDTISLEEYK